MSTKRTLKPCGTHAAYQRHLYRGELACSVCLAAHAEHEMARRRARGIRPQTRPRHGTAGGYFAHRYRKQPACYRCLDAYNEYSAARRRR